MKYINKQHYLLVLKMTLGSPVLGYGSYLLINAPKFTIKEFGIRKNTLNELINELLGIYGCTY